MRCIYRFPIEFRFKQLLKNKSNCSRARNFETNFLFRDYAKIYLRHLPLLNFKLKYYILKVLTIISAYEDELKI